jgi:TrkA domain protein
MVEISETPLPGVGARFDLTTAAGQPLAVLSRPSGRRDLVVYSEDDPDAVETTITFTTEEAAAVAQLLGAAAITEELSGLQTLVQGLAIDWLTIPDGQAQRTIGELAIRTTTGSSVIAIVRDNMPIPAPGPDEPLRGGDTVLLAGTPDGIAAACALLGG